jgi:hypothetical protein
MQQYVIVMVAYIFIALNNIWIPAIVSGFCHLTRRHDRSSAKPAAARSIGKRITSVKQIDTLVTALLAFQNFSSPSHCRSLASTQYTTLRSSPLDRPESSSLACYY